MSLRAAGLPVIIGGPHPTFVPDDALPHADFVARGEGGDGLMLELIEALAGERELESIRGLSFWRDRRPVHNELRERCADLDSLPIPDLSLIVGSKRIRETPIMTSLGCPFDCTFCTVTMMFGRAYRCRSPENVIAELEASEAEVGLLLRRQLRRRQAAPQDAPRDDDRPWPHARSGWPRCAPTWPATKSC